MKIAWKSIAVTLIIGFILGVAFNRWGAHHQWDKGKYEGHEKRVMKRLSSKLHLNQNQREQIEAILEERSPQMKELHEKMWPKFDEIRKSMNAAIRPILDSKQQAKFDQMEAEWQERAQKFHSKQA